MECASQLDPHARDGLHVGVVELDRCAAGPSGRGLQARFRGARGGATASVECAAMPALLAFLAFVSLPVMMARADGPALLRVVLPLRQPAAAGALTLAVLGFLARRRGAGSLLATALFFGLTRLVDPTRLFPALDGPPARPAEHAGIGGNALVVGVEAGDGARAYHLDTLAPHHLINDVLGGEPVLVSYCPLCRSGVVFDPRVDGRRLTFRVAGLWRRNMLMRDLETGTIWQQVTGEALAGPLAGRALEMLPGELTTWAAWRGDHPGTTAVVDPPARAAAPRRRFLLWGFRVFSGRANAVVGGLAPRDPRLPGTEEVAGVELGGETRAYPLAALARVGVANEEVGGRPVAVVYDREVDRVRVFERPDGAALRRAGGTLVADGAGARWDARGRPLDGGAALRTVPFKRELWLSWSEFHPGTSVCAAPAGTA